MKKNDQILHLVVFLRDKGSKILFHFCNKCLKMIRSPFYWHVCFYCSPLLVTVVKMLIFINMKTTNTFAEVTKNINE